MSTRGLYGFRKNGIDKTTYNHSDSYPSYLGRHIAEFCASTSTDEMNNLYDRIELVDEHSKPTLDQVMKYVGYYDSAVSRGTAEDWYCLLRDLQGNLTELKKINGTIHMIDSVNFIKDSLFCEYAYIINLDTKVLEFWVGFQKEPDEGNRYGTESDDGYYPCKLKYEFDLEGFDANVATETMCDIENELYG